MKYGVVVEHMTGSEDGMALHWCGSRTGAEKWLIDYKKAKDATDNNCRRYTIVQVMWSIED